MIKSIIISLMSVLLFASCGSSPPVQRYILTPSIEQGKETLPGNSDVDVTIGIGSIEFSDYLRRPEIVSFKGNNELNVDQFNRWAEPLEENFERVLIENLSRLIPTNKIYIFPLQAEEPNSFLITIAVNEFGMRADSMVVLDARWNVSKNFKRDFLMTKKSFYSENAAGVSSEEVVALLSKLVGEFSRDIAEEIRKEIE